MSVNRNATVPDGNPSFSRDFVAGGEESIGRYILLRGHDPGKGTKIPRSCGVGGSRQPAKLQGKTLRRIAVMQRVFSAARAAFAIGFFALAFVSCAGQGQQLPSTSPQAQSAALSRRRYLRFAARPRIQRHDLAARRKRAAARDTQCASRLYHAGECIDAQSASRSQLSAAADDHAGESISLPDYYPDNRILVPSAVRPQRSTFWCQLLSDGSTTAGGFVAETGRRSD